MPAAVLVPVKRFTDAKVRLAPALDPEARRLLARSMAEKVLHAAGDLAVFVVCDDHEVREWATGMGAGVVWSPGLGLNGAVSLGLEHVARAGFGQVVVSHADLPLADDLTWLPNFAGATLVPDRHGDGTNVMCVPAGVGFRVAYGPGSYSRHRTEARRCGLAVRVAHRAELAWDVDLPADLEYSVRA